MTTWHPSRLLGLVTSVSAVDRGRVLNIAPMPSVTMAANSADPRCAAWRLRVCLRRW